MIGILVSIFIALGLIGAYYVHVYFWEKCKPLNYSHHSASQHREDEEEMTKHKLIFVGLYTLITIVLYAFLTPGDDMIEKFKIGINLHAIWAIIQTIIINSLLFLGTLIQNYHEDGCLEILQNLRAKSWVTKKGIYATSFVEELLFRVMIMGILKLENYSDSEIRWICSIIFSLSHVHNISRLRNLPLMTALLNVTAQAVITFVFSFYCCTIMLKFQCFYCAFLLHALCNSIGVPMFGALFPLELKDSRKMTALLGYIIGIPLFFYFI